MVTDCFYLTVGDATRRADLGQVRVSLIEGILVSIRRPVPVYFVDLIEAFTRVPRRPNYGHELYSRISALQRRCTSAGVTAG